MTAFNDVALDIMQGVTAGELKQLQEANDTAGFEAKFSKAVFQERVVTLSAKADTYKDEMQVRVTLRRAHPVDFVVESQNIINALKEFA